MTSVYSSAESLGAARVDWLAVLVRVPAAQVIEAAAGLSVQFDVLKAPEVGLMMTKGRIHSTGQSFRVGEVTVTRSVIQDADGRLGYGQILGRNQAQCLAIATFDLALQRTDVAPACQALLDRWRSEIESLDALETDAIDETRVQFFTMVRGEA